MDLDVAPGGLNRSVAEKINIFKTSPDYSGYKIDGKMPEGMTLEPKNIKSVSDPIIARVSAMGTETFWLDFHETDHTKLKSVQPKANANVPGAGVGIEVGQSTEKDETHKVTLDY
jgi:hypothetical protein